MRLRTLVRAYFLAQSQAREAAWAQGFTGRGSTKEKPAELRRRLDFMAKRYKQSAAFREYVRQAVDLSGPDSGWSLGNPQSTA